MILLNRLFAWLGYIPANTPRTYERVNNGVDAVARGQRYEAFYAEEGGLRDMFDSLRADYFEKVGQLSPGDTDKLLALGMANKIVSEVERKFTVVIETGKIRANDREHAGRIARIGR